MTEEQKAWIKQRIEDYNNSARSRNDNNINAVQFIAVKPYLIADDIGEGVLDLSDLQGALDNANVQFARTGIQFYLLDPVQVNSNRFYEFEANDDEDDLFSSHFQANTINAYFTGSVTRSGNSVCGYAYFPGGRDITIMASNCINKDNYTFAHELGHFFNLYHTHGKSNTQLTDEFVNGSNCSVAGDEVCDTPAEPNLTGLVNNDCEYIGNLIDANQDAFQPTVNNIMSYGRDACNVPLTAGQNQRIITANNALRNYLTGYSENSFASFEADKNTVFINEMVAFTDQSLDAVSWEWFFEGAATEISFNQNPLVSYASPGSYDVQLTITDGQDEEKTFLFEDYITVEGPVDITIYSPDEWGSDVRFFVVDENEEKVYKQEFEAGDYLYMEYGVQNLGDRPATSTSFKVGIYLNGDRKWLSTWTLGIRSALTANMVRLGLVGPGENELRIVFDEDDDYEEFDENNNLFLTTLSVQEVDLPEFIAGADVRGIEYYIDNYTGFGNGNFVAKNNADPSEYDFIINVDGLSNGLHHLYARPLDESGRWGATIKRSFYVLPVEREGIKYAEYYFDIDPGYGDGNSIELSNGFNNRLIDLSALSDGFHSLYVRVQNEMGRWSNTQYATFIKSREFSNPKLKSINYQVFDYTSGTFVKNETITLDPRTDRFEDVIFVDTEGLEEEVTYGLFVRAKDENNVESDYAIELFSFSNALEVGSTNASIEENPFTNQLIETLSVTSPNNSVFTYRIYSGNEDNIFTLDENTGELKVSQPEAFDFEQKAFYNLTVGTFLNESLVRVFDFTVNLTNVNEAPIELSISNTSILESLDIDSPLGTLSTVDLDIGDIFTYSLVEGVGDHDNASFIIEGDELRLNEALDFETKQALSIRVAVSDASGLTFQKQFEIAVTNVNEPPIITAEISDAVVLEDAEDFVLVSSLSSYFSDLDDLDEFTIDFLNTESDGVSLSISGDDLLVALTDDFNGTDLITITATDQEGLSVNQQFELQITPVNDPPIINLVKTNIVLNENFDGEEVVTISINQPENESDQIISYTLNPTSLDFIDTEFRENQLILAAKVDRVGSFSGLEIIADDGQAENNTAKASLDVSVFENIQTAIAGDDWYQFADRITGVDNDHLGYAMDLSRDGKSLVVGAKYANNGEGEVRVYAYENDQWIQKGQTLVGKLVNQTLTNNLLTGQTGHSVAINDAGNIIAIGNPENRSYDHSGLVQVYEFRDGFWYIKDNEIIGLKSEGNNGGLGYSLDLDSSGEILAIGIPSSSVVDENNTSFFGSVLTYKFQNGVWQQFGGRLYAEGNELYSNRFGFSVSLNKQGDVIAIGDPSANGGTNDRGGIGTVNVFKLNQNEWVRLGDDIVGERSNTLSGTALDLSDDGLTVVIGGPNNDEFENPNIPGAGHARVFKFSNTDWQQLGQDLDGVNPTDNYGASVSINGAGDVIAVGSLAHNTSLGTNDGEVKVFALNENHNWGQIAADINGEFGMALGQVVDLDVSGRILAASSFDYPNSNSGRSESPGAVNFFELNFKPSVLNVEVDGELIVQETLSANYSFIDRDNDQENGTLFQWYRLNSESGNDQAIEAATSRTYILTNADVGLQMSVEVTPFDGKSYGAKQKSVFYGPVKANQLITFGSLSTKQYGDGSFDLTASADSDLEIIYSSSDPSVATIEGSQLTIVGAGSTEITASQLGNDIYFEAEDVSQTLVISPATLTALAEDKSKTYGETNPELTIIYDGFVNGDDEIDITEPTVSTSVDATSGVGTYSITLSEGSAINYTITTTDGILIVNPATLTATAEDKSKTYGEANPTLTISYSGFVNGDDETAIIEPTIATTADETSFVGDYDITLTGESAGNYTITTIDGKLTIDERPITVTADAKSKVYGEADPSLTYQITSGSLVNSDGITGELSRTTGEDVNDYAINQNTLIAGSNYDLTYISNDLTISKATLTATAEDKSKTYGEANPTLTISYSGFQNGDDETAITKPTIATTADETSIVGDYAITLTGGSANNYTISTTNGILTINERPITVTADAKSKVYGEADPSFTYQITSGSLLNSDRITGEISRTTGEGVNDYAINQNSLTAGSNYDLTYISNDLTISKATLTATAEDKSKTYGEANPTLTISYSGFQNGDDETAITKPTIATTADETSFVGDYDITLTGGSATNYTISTTNGILTINERPITVTADAKSKVYGEDDPALTYQITSGSLVNFDAITGALSRTTGEGVNDYAINQNTLTAGSNYDLTYVSADLSISKATLTATAEDKSKTYGEANPTLTISYSGFQNGDDETAITKPTIATTADETSIVGEYDITLTGGSSDNYDLSIVDGVLTVTKAPLSVTVQDETINKGDAIPEFSISYNGFVNSEDESVLTTTPTASTSANSTSDRGTYAIELSDGSAVNYTVNIVDGILTVTGPVYTLPSTISFTDPVVLGDTETETIVLDNTGDGALNVTGIAVPSGYSIDQTSFNVSNGSVTTLTLTFAPLAAQTYNGDIIITSNNGEDKITVKGEGQIVTGIDDDRLDLSEVKVYPNPSDKLLTIDLSDSPSNQANLMLVDPQGKTAWQKQEVSDREIRVNTSTFSSGFYLLIVQTDKGSVIKKVMVQH
jgi:hypothetical protein